MQIGLIGLGKMGYNLALNFRKHNHEVVAFDINKAVVDQIGAEGVRTASAVSELIEMLAPPRIIWIMVPAGQAVDALLNEIKESLTPNDILIDGGNSFYKDSVARASDMEKLGMYFLDCGTSGGLSGALNGVCAMVGGNKKAFDQCEPLLKSIAVENGLLYCGESGSGHFVKMVHNGIEYGMMQAIAEGFEVLHKRYPEMNLESVSSVWNHGSVIRSWLMELTEQAFMKNRNLESIKDVMHSSGEGKWTVETALELGVPTPVITLSLLARYRSQQDESFAGKIVAALRSEFGGHAVESKTE